MKEQKKPNANAEPVSATGRPFSAIADSLGGLYKVIFENTGTAMVIVREDTTIELVNSEFLRLTGYERDDVERKKSWKELVAQEDLKKINRYNLAKRTRARQVAKNIEFRLIDKKTNLMEVLATIETIPSTDLYIVSLLNITRSKRTEKLLREAEERYRSFFENAMVGIFQSTPHGKYITMNMALARIHGYSSPDEMIRTVTDIGSQLYVNPEDRLRYMKLLEKSDVIRGFEAILYRKDRSKVWISMNVRVVRDEQSGKPLYFEGIVEDVTEKKTSEDALKRSEELYRSLFDDNIDGIIITVDGKIVRYNHALTLLFGDECEQIVGNYALDCIHPDDREIARSRYQAVQTGGALPESYVYRVLRPDGTVVLCEARSRRIEWDKRLAVQTIVRDVTKQLQAEKKINRYLERLEKMQEIDRSILANDSPETVARVSLDRLTKLIPCQQALVVILNQEDRLATVLASVSDSDTIFTVGYRFPFTMFSDLKGLVDGNYRSVGTLDRASARTLLEEHFSEEGMRSFIEIPIHTGKHLIGVIYFSSKYSDAFTHENIDVAREVALVLAIAFEQKKAEAALRFTQFAMDNAAVGILWLSQEGQVLYANYAMTNFLGYSREEFMEMAIFDIVPGLGRGVWKKHWQDLKKNRSMTIESEHTAKDGQVSPVEANINYMEFDGIGYAYIMVVNIADRKKKEELLRLTQFSVESASLPTFWIDSAGGLLHVNAAACRVLGYAEEELRLLKTQDWDAGFSTLRWSELIPELAAQKSVTFLTFLKRKDGSTFPAEINLNYLEYSGERYYFAYASDITERVRAEEEKERLQTQLLQAQKMEAIGTLAGGIAHDFNNLLMGIQGYTSLMLLDEPPGHRHHDRLKRIESQVQSGAELTKQLLGFARGGKYHVKPTNINDLLKKTANMFGRTKKEIAIHVKHEDALFVVDVDQGQMEQVFLNLFLNAWQAMPSGGDLFIETQNRLVEEAESAYYGIPAGKYAGVFVTDTGVGMDEITRQRIFEPFFTTKEMGHGAGLGLASAYGIIKNHGGTISAYSEKGEGTTFVIYLPASAREIVEDEKPLPKLETGSETLLLVDDQEVVLDVGRELLEALGYTVLLSKGGKEALEIFQKNMAIISLVVLDMIMPSMSGRETYDRLKEINPGVKVILSSGYSIDGEAKKILERGVNGFIQKPFNIFQVSRIVRNVIDEV